MSWPATVTGIEKSMCSRLQNFVRILDWLAWPSKTLPRFQCTDIVLPPGRLLAIHFGLWTSWLRKDLLTIQASSLCTTICTEFRAPAAIRGFTHLPRETSCWNFLPLLSNFVEPTWPRLVADISGFCPCNSQNGRFSVLKKNRSRSCFTCTRGKLIRDSPGLPLH